MQGDEEIGAFVRANYRDIGDGLDAGADWYNYSTHEGDCAPGCDGCADEGRAENWRDLNAQLTVLIGRSWQDLA